MLSWLRRDYVANQVSNEWMEGVVFNSPIEGVVATCNRVRDGTCRVASRLAFVVSRLAWRVVRHSAYLGRNNGQITTLLS